MISYLKKFKWTIVAAAVAVAFALVVRVTLPLFAQAPIGPCQENFGAAPVINKAHSGSIDVLSACVDTGSGTPQWIQFWPVNPANGILANSIVSGQLATNLIQSVAFTFTSTQVNAMSATPLTLVAAQGAGTYVEPISAVLENVFGTAAYMSGGAIGLYYTNNAGVLASSTAASTFLTSPTASQMILLTGALASNLSSGVLNKALVLTNATGAFTTGDGSLQIRLKYRIHTGL